MSQDESGDSDFYTMLGPKPEALVYRAPDELAITPDALIRDTEGERHGVYSFGQYLKVYNSKNELLREGMIVALNYDYYMAPTPNQEATFWERLEEPPTIRNSVTGAEEQAFPPFSNARVEIYTEDPEATIEDDELLFELELDTAPLQKSTTYRCNSCKTQNMHWYHGVRSAPSGVWYCSEACATTM